MQIQQALTPNFDAFKNGWPIRDLMAQYMANSKQGAKKHQKLLNDGKENFVDMVSSALCSVSEHKTLIVDISSTMQRRLWKWVSTMSINRNHPR